MAANRADNESMLQVKCPMGLDDVDLFAPGAQEF